jgi:hypothetical protein
MDDIDISREACEDHANYCRGFGPSTTPDLILALRAALDRDKASGWKAIDRAVALTFANDVLQAKLDAAEADKAAAVDAERERCAAVVLSYCGTLNDGRPYYIDLDSTDTDKMFAAIRTGAKP